MQVTNPTLLTAPAAVSPIQPSDNSQRESRFASLLRQNQVPVAAHAPAAPVKADAGVATATQDGPVPPDCDAPDAPQNNINPTARFRPKAGEKPPIARPAEHADKSLKSAAEQAPPAEATADRREPRDADATATPPIALWLTALPHPTDAALPKSGPSVGKRDNIDTSAPLASNGTTGTRTDAALCVSSSGPDPKAGAEAHKERQDGSARETAQPSAATLFDNLAALRAAGPGNDEQRSLQGVHTDSPSMPAAPAAAGFDPTSRSLQEMAAPATVNLPTPLASPEFAQALGVQMSVLARDGVQQAELQLNPAEMGPVSVQIVIDGTTAQVDFGADLAATRHAIEAGLPELAGALRDAGFTLTGGGVSQHSRGRGDGGESSADSGRGGQRGIGQRVEAIAPRALRRAVSVGGVDLYA